MLITKIISPEGRKLFALFNEKSGTQEQCADFCSEKGGQLPTVLNSAANTQLVWQMMHYDVEMTWIGVLQSYHTFRLVCLLNCVCVEVLSLQVQTSLVLLLYNAYIISDPTHRIDTLGRSIRHDRGKCK